MTKRELVAPPVGTIYQLRHHGWRAALRDNEYWQVERRTEKTVWLRQLVTDTEGKPDTRHDPHGHPPTSVPSPPRCVPVRP